MTQPTLFEANKPESMNPFRRQIGDCSACTADRGRIFWCHACEGMFCWDCLVSHKD